MSETPDQSNVSMTQRAQANDTAELAIAYTKERQYDEALHYFRKATAFTPEAMSYYGLALAMRRQRLDDAVEFCRQAIDRDPIRAELYYNLGQVYLVREEKKLAVRAFWQGLRVDPKHPNLIAAVKRLGMRRRPMVEGLARTNMFNRHLGWFRHRVKKVGC